MRKRDPDIMHNGFRFDVKDLIKSHISINSNDLESKQRAIRDNKNTHCHLNRENLIPHPHPPPPKKKKRKKKA